MLRVIAREMRAYLAPMPPRVGLGSAVTVLAREADLSDDDAHDCARAASPVARRRWPPVTYSVVAHDPATGDLGIAVATQGPAVGTVVPYARAGVGAIALQSAGDFAYGPRGLDRVAAGMAPTDVIAELTAGDRDVAHRQVGLVDARGRAATFTGDACDPWAGGVAGPHYACQGNRLTGPGVVDAMAAAFEGTAGDLDVRLLAALLAGDAAGGDRLGRQSAALLVVREGPESRFDGRHVDLRVDDHADPVAELARLLNVWRPAVRLPPHTITRASAGRASGARGRDHMGAARRGDSRGG